MDNYNYDRYMKERYVVLGGRIMRNLTWSGRSRGGCP